MEYKKGDIIKILPDKIHSHCMYAENYRDFLFIFNGIEHNKSTDSHYLELNVKGIFNNEQYGYNDYSLYTKHLRLANKEDLKEYLLFIFTNEKIWIKISDSSEGRMIAKIINKKYPYEKLTLPEDIVKYDRYYFNRKQLWSNINEEEWLKKGYHIIKFEDIRHIINKIHGK